MRSNWMQTYTGRAFYPTEPRVEDVCIEDIAHSLSLTCRYAGHVRRFYSVAEHCVLMSRAVSPENALAALLHDATEAYVGDLVRPLKQQLPEYAAVEERLAAVIAEKFGISPVAPPAVKDADLRICIDERNNLMAPPPMPWGALVGLQPLGVRPVGFPPEAAERIYLDRFHLLRP